MTCRRPAIAPPDHARTFVAVATESAAAGGTWATANSARNYRKATSHSAAAVVAAEAAGRQPADCPADSGGTATCLGISGPNAAPSPITYHPCARSSARRRDVHVYRHIYKSAIEPSSRMPPFVLYFEFSLSNLCQISSWKLQCTIVRVNFRSINKLLCISIPRWVRHVRGMSIARARYLRELVTARQSFNVLEARPGAPFDVAINDDDDDDVDDNKSAQSR